MLIGWVAFRATDVGLAMDFYAGMLGANGWALPTDIAVQITRESLAVLMLAILLNIRSYRAHRQAMTIGSHRAQHAAGYLDEHAI